MRVNIKPAKASGTVTAPASKSMAHRQLICAGLAEGVSFIRGVDLNEDILATIDCLQAMGAKCTVENGGVRVVGAPVHQADPKTPLCCRESGSTLRFFIPLALLCGKKVCFTGTKKLLSRPLDVYAQLCREHGFTFEQKEDSLQVAGRLAAGAYSVSGDISSQFITGLLLALPLTGQESSIHITTPIESKSYIDLTIGAMQSFGVLAQWKDEKTIYIPVGQRYKAQDTSVEADYSGAAFFAAMNALGADITIAGLQQDSLQGDKIYEKYLPSLCNGRPQIDLTDCPDLGPVLFAVAAAKNGAVFTGTRRLKLKESDRAAAMAQELSAFGTEVTVEENTVTVTAAAFHKPDRVLSGHNDHRIVMALAVLLTLTGGQIEGAEAVQKSFPDFFEKLTQFGIEVIRENG